MALLIVWLALATAADAQTIRVWGSAQMTNLVERWERGFANTRPRVHFENHMYGAVSAIAGLYTGVADIAISREIWPIEEQAFEQVTGHSVTAFEVATGSFDYPTKSSALHVFVHKDNPVGRLTIAQLDAIFGGEHRRGVANIRSWRDVGWISQPIHTYGYKLDNAGAILFARLVLMGSPKWNEGFQGFGNVMAPDGARLDAGQLILDALAHDPLGIAISNIRYSRAEVKPVAVGGVAPSRKVTQDRSYPLTRSVFLFVDAVPGRAIEANVKEFLTYVLSEPGQLDVEAEGGYLPLPTRIANAESARLK